MAKFHFFWSDKTYMQEKSTRFTESQGKANPER